MIDSCNKNNVQSDYPIDYQKLDRMVRRMFTIKRLWGISTTHKLYPNVSKEILSKYDYIKK